MMLDSGDLLKVQGASWINLIWGDEAHTSKTVMVQLPVNNAISADVMQ